MGRRNFTDFLPPSMRWLVWDKMQGEFSRRLRVRTWTSQNAASRIFRYSRGAALKDGKVHPTQKPVALMEWCLGFLPDAKTILDPMPEAGRWPWHVSAWGGGQQASKSTPITSRLCAGVWMKQPGSRALICRNQSPSPSGVISMTGRNYRRAEKACEICGERFTVPNYRKDIARFCSRSCRSAMIAAKYFNTGPKPWAAKNLDGHRLSNRPRNSARDTPPNKDMKGIHLSPASEFQKGRECETRAETGEIRIRHFKNDNPGRL